MTTITARLYRINGIIYYDLNEIINEFYGEDRELFSQYVVGKTLLLESGEHYVFRHDVIHFMEELKNAKKKNTNP